MAPSAYNKLQNKHVLILGGSSGIGYAVADGSLASGAKVTISSSSQTKVDAAVSRLKSDYPSQTDTIVGFPADLSNPTKVEDDLDVLFKKAESTHVASRYLPKENTSSITITSGSATKKPAKGWTLMSNYGGGLSTLAKALAVDLAPIRANVVRPGYVETELWTEEQKASTAKAVAKSTLTGVPAKGEDVAEAYLWLMNDSNVTGAAAETDSGGLLA
ncbi:uncharacterized protein PODANS_1_15785 [Podospora anserina S mat+]|uniref:Podospora anserina S mat+ genomic DNA chromosome 1, supercontig 4 n=1 Tax=Podospora anserina (strain S / ATCC MYA-4624 / DSM 980 / FGSC 10383) TaxID=515849 RepID=B2ATG5_PODAN|nr:uncharacterized protein PODANS_1_15785 [Podospora anserina S mat+]CAP67688.1 unnamed protein product [Podospora anserina S mat+]CDP23947.1 Putative protein of unknown function [Podospora anserina S mat+]